MAEALPAPYSLFQPPSPVLSVVRPAAAFFEKTVAAARTGLPHCPSEFQQQSGPVASGSPASDTQQSSVHTSLAPLRVEMPNIGGFAVPDSSGGNSVIRPQLRTAPSLDAQHRELQALFDDNSATRWQDGRSQVQAAQHMNEYQLFDKPQRLQITADATSGEGQFLSANFQYSPQRAYTSNSGACASACIHSNNVHGHPGQPHSPGKHAAWRRTDPEFVWCQQMPDDLPWSPAVAKGSMYMRGSPSASHSLPVSPQRAACGPVQQLCNYNLQQLWQPDMPQSAPATPVAQGKQNQHLLAWGAAEGQDATVTIQAPASTSPPHPSQRLIVMQSSAMTNQSALRQQPDHQRGDCSQQADITPMSLLECVFEGLLSTRIARCCDLNSPSTSPQHGSISHCILMPQHHQGGASPTALAAKLQPVPPRLPHPLLDQLRTGGTSEVQPTACPAVVSGCSGGSVCSGEAQEEQEAQVSRTTFDSLRARLPSSLSLLTEVESPCSTLQPPAGSGHGCVVLPEAIDATEVNERINCGGASEAANSIHDEVGRFDRLGGCESDDCAGCSYSQYGSHFREGQHGASTHHHVGYSPRAHGTRHKGKHAARWQQELQGVQEVDDLLGDAMQLLHATAGSPEHGGQAGAGEAMMQHLLWLLEQLEPQDVIQLLEWCAAAGVAPLRQVVDAAVGAVAEQDALTHAGPLEVIRLLAMVNQWGAGAAALQELLPLVEKVLEEAMRGICTNRAPPSWLHSDHLLALSESLKHLHFAAYGSRVQLSSSFVYAFVQGFMASHRAHQMRQRQAGAG